MCLFISLIFARFVLSVSSCGLVGVSHVFKKVDIRSLRILLHICVLSLKSLYIGKCIVDFLLLTILLVMVCFSTVYL